MSSPLTSLQSLWRKPYSNYRLAVSSRSLIFNSMLSWQKVSIQKISFMATLLQNLASKGLRKWVRGIFLLEETLSSFQIEVHDLHPEEERQKGGFCNPIQVSCSCLSGNQQETAEPENKVLSCHQKVLIVWRHLFRANAIMEKF